MVLLIMEKKDPIKVLKEKSKYLDVEVIEELKNDYDELVEEKNEEIESLKSELNESKFKIMDLFELLTFEQKRQLYLQSKL